MRPATSPNAPNLIPLGFPAVIARLPAPLHLPLPTVMPLRRLPLTHTYAPLKLQTSDT